MKTVGLIGGMSWESSLTYYQRINQQIKQRKGGLHSAPLILYSVDFAHIAELQHNNDWRTIWRPLAKVSKKPAPTPWRFAPTRCIKWHHR